MEVQQSLFNLCQLLEQKKAEDILIFDTRKMNNVADFYIIATSTSSTHTKGIADFLEIEALKIKDFNYVSREGFNLSDWVVLDINNIFVHILTKTKRDYYSLEKLLNEGNNFKTFNKLKQELNIEETHTNKIPNNPKKNTLKNKIKDKVNKNLQKNNKTKKVNKKN